MFSQAFDCCYGVSDAVQAVTREWTANYWWLVVCLDSSEYNRSDRVEHIISKILHEAQANFQWAPGGLWLPAASMSSAAVQRRLLVHFSAAYLFAERRPEFIPEFTATSESEWDGGAAPPKLVAEMKSSGALMYVADGVGLQYCVADPTLYEALKAHGL